MSYISSYFDGWPLETEILLTCIVLTDFGGGDFKLS